VFVGGGSSKDEVKDHGVWSEWRDPLARRMLGVFGLGFVGWAVGQGSRNRVEFEGYRPVYCLPFLLSS
jgi:hypothetical protein